jgi:hypothetical protein
MNRLIFPPYRGGGGILQIYTPELGKYALRADIGRCYLGENYDREGSWRIEKRKEKNGKMKVKFKPKG